MQISPGTVRGALELSLGLEDILAQSFAHKQGFEWGNWGVKPEEQPDLGAAAFPSEAPTLLYLLPHGRLSFLGLPKDFLLKKQKGVGWACLPRGNKERKK